MSRRIRNHRHESRFSRQVAVIDPQEFESVLVLGTEAASRPLPAEILENRIEIEEMGEIAPTDTPFIWANVRD